MLVWGPGRFKLEPCVRSRSFRLSNGVFAAIFALSAALQYNDPDPWGWAAIYTAAAIACLAAWRAPSSRLLPAGVGVAALIWVGTLSGVVPDIRITDLARSMKAETPSIELGREFLGLLIIASWMVLLFVSAHRSPRSATK